MKSQPKHHRRENRPAIAKRYNIDGGCITGCIPVENYRLKMRTPRDYGKSLEQAKLKR